MVPNLMILIPFWCAFFSAMSAFLLMNSISGRMMILQCLLIFPSESVFSVRNPTGKL